MRRRNPSAGWPSDFHTAWACDGHARISALDKGIRRTLCPRAKILGAELLSNDHPRMNTESWFERLFGGRCQWLRRFIVGAGAASPHLGVYPTFERRYIVETIVVHRPRDQLAPFPIAQSSAHVFTRDPGDCREIILAELVADNDASGRLLFAENLRELKQDARQAGFDWQKTVGGHGLAGFPQACR